MGVLMHDIYGPQSDGPHQDPVYVMEFNNLIAYIDKSFHRFEIFDLRNCITSWKNSSSSENAGYIGPPKNGLFIAYRDPHLKMRDNYRQWCTKLKWSLQKFEESITKLNSFLNAGELEEAMKLVDDELETMCFQRFVRRSRQTQEMVKAHECINNHIAGLFSARGFDFLKEHEMYQYVKRIHQNPASKDTNKVFLKQFESVPLLFRASALKKRYAQDSGLVSILHIAADAADAPQRAAEEARRLHEEQLEQQKQQEAEAEKRRRQREAAEKARAEAEERKRREAEENAIWGLGGMVFTMPPVYADHRPFVQPPLYESLRPSVGHTFSKN